MTKNQYTVRVALSLDYLSDESISPEDIQERIEKHVKGWLDGELAATCLSTLVASDSSVSVS